MRRAVALAFLLAGCGEFADSASPDAGAPDGHPYDPSDPECDDAIDNDHDGMIDRLDPDCETPQDDHEAWRAQCRDQMDNDGDGKTDFPYDPGCIDYWDATEADPVPAPACSDGVDNDDDGDIDYGFDSGCGNAADDDELSSEWWMWFWCEGEDITETGQASGSITTSLPREQASPVCHGYGHERLFEVQVTGGPRTLVISTDHPETKVDTVVYVRTQCRRPDSELGCDDDGGVLPGTSTLTVEIVEPGTYFIVVDSFSPGSLGDFKVTVD